MTADLSQTPSLLRAGRDRPDGAVHPACGLTRSGLAQLVGAGVETVSRVLAQFVERGRIITGEEEADVLDAVALRRGALIGRVAPTAAAGRNGPCTSSAAPGLAVHTGDGRGAAGADGCAGG
ncbi:helix-turn-helix domain-containing protein [Mycolicibacterium tokaiense]|uniref:helix-turn-helix domain-containing protein n=1 Tax=Mycolicibacterium tokaiense TaxID=39695 RepID=UPI000E1C05F1|nr:hypothetical protein MTOK_50610 [Mycolicibacterium tokaiense]